VAIRDLLLDRFRAEAQVRREGPPTFDLEAALSPAQRIRALCPERFQAWPAGRQSGKTDAAEKLLLQVASLRKNQLALYVNTSKERAIATVWDELCLFVDDLPGLKESKAKPNHGNHTIRFPRGGKLMVTGVENMKMANVIRGLKKVAFYFVDECQDWKDDLLRYFYEKVIFPSLVAVSGSVVFSGTGGNPRGFWYEIATRSPEFVRHGKWTPFDNPFLPPGEAQRLIDKAMRDRGCDINDPSIQREFFAGFVADLNRQIFHYDDARNGYDAADLPPDDGRWQFAIGMDVGTVDYTAVHVWGWHPSSPRLWKRASVKRKDLGSSGQAALIRETVAEWRTRGTIMGVVGDPGGGGKPLIVDMKGAWPGVGTGNMEVAEKADKPAACMMMRDDLRNGTIAIDRADKDFIADLQVPEWEPDAVQKVIRNHFPDTVDAALYAYRLARHHWYKAPAPEPEDHELAERRRRIQGRIKESVALRNPLGRRDARRLLR